LTDYTIELDGDFKFIVLTLTRRCPLRCSYCNYARNDMPEMPLEFWISVLDKFPNAEYVLFGGDPVEYKHFWDLLEIMNKRETGYTVSTTGINLQDEDFDKMVSVSVSLDTLDTKITKPEHRKSIRGWEVVLLRKENPKGVDFAGITMTKDNINEMPFLAESLRDTTFLGCFNVVQTKTELGKDTDLKPTRKQLEKFVEFVKETYHWGVYADPLEFYELLPTKGIAQDWFCKGEVLLTVDSDGTVAPCYQVKSNGHTMADYKHAQKCEGCFLNCFWVWTEMPQFCICQQGEKNV